MSRIISISIIAFLFPHWTILACGIHILITATLLQIFDRSPFCSNNCVGSIFFSIALGGVYLFTYIIPVEGKTRYRYAIYYTICFFQNLASAVVWYIFGRNEVYFYLLLTFTMVPYLAGIIIMVIYYRFFHPKVSKRQFAVSFRSGNENEMSSC